MGTKWNQGLTFTCPVCGKSKYRPPSEVAKGCTLTCGTKCRAVLQRKSVERNCRECGKVFLARLAQIKQGYANFCSKPCFTVQYRKTTTYHCVTCSASFERMQWQIAKGYTLYCSRRCKDHFCRSIGKGRERNLFTMWQKREWLEKSCVTCRSTTKLELDHIVPKFAGGTTERTNAQTLCRKCNNEKYWKIDLPKYAGDLLRPRPAQC